MYQNPARSSRLNMVSIGKTLRVVADPNRLRILLAASRRGAIRRRVAENSSHGPKHYSTTSPSSSKAGLVEDRHRQKQTSNRLTPAGGGPLMRFLARGRSKSPNPGLTRRMRRVSEKKTRQDAQFFDSVAGPLGQGLRPGKSWKSVAEALLC